MIRDVGMEVGTAMQPVVEILVADVVLCMGILLEGGMLGVYMLVFGVLFGIQIMLMLDVKLLDVGTVLGVGILLGLVMLLDVGVVLAVGILMAVLLDGEVVMVVGILMAVKVLLGMGVVLVVGSLLVEVVVVFQVGVLGNVPR